ncbi:MAG TPA: hypothetical protein VMW73_13090 [Spirochaetia bacterium]|nr:hypothetical protein [Spirochaetia bacterium]
MKKPKLMKERIRRVSVLFKELGYELQDSEYFDDTYTSAILADDGFQAGLFIDRESKFLEMAFTFSFSPSLSEFIKARIEEMLHVTYEYGCYLSIQNSSREISFSVFSKIYYVGLNYLCLRETVKDFRASIEALQELLEIQKEFGKGATHGDT